jgi:phosphate starvation-inducible membrane PsiE
LKQKYELCILSSIPQYYLRTLLGFTTYTGMKDILRDLLAKHGKQHKVLAVSDAEIILLKAIL